LTPNLPNFEAARPSAAKIQLRGRLRGRSIKGTLVQKQLAGNFECAIQGESRPEDTSTRKCIENEQRNMESWTHVLHENPPCLCIDIRLYENNLPKRKRDVRGIAT
jgi:hypothetical protein